MVTASRVVLNVLRAWTTTLAAHVPSASVKVGDCVGIHVGEPSATPPEGARELGEPRWTHYRIGPGLRLDWASRTTLCA